MRKCPSPTGFFKVDNLFGELLTEAHKSIARKNLGIDKSSYNSDEIWVGDTPPENTNQLWLEPSQDEYINQEGNLSAIRQSIYQLQQQMNKVIQLIQYGIIAGDSSCGGRTQMMNEEIINPETGEVQLIEPIKLKGTVPNISIKCDTQANFALNKNNLIDGELIWLTDKNSLCIYLDGKFKAISNSSIPEQEEMTQEDIEKLYFNSLGFIDVNETQYRLELNNNGNIVIYNTEKNDPEILKPTSGSYVSDYLRINSIFIGDVDLDSFAACSHNFVELANASLEDINLYGIYLMYKRPGESNWEKIELKGTIKSGSTFLIRGARCAYTSNVTLDIDTYDMEWYDSTKSLIKFSKKGGCFYLAGSKEGKLHNGISWVDTIDGIDPYIQDNAGQVKGYIDLVGIKIPKYASDTVVHAEGGNPIQLTSTEDAKDCIFVRSFALDPCSQAQKAWSTRKSSTLWTYINMNKFGTDPYPYYTMSDKYKYVPKASFKDKNIFGIRSVFSKEYPNMINITFGIQATDSGNGATRCFNWVSFGYNNEYIEYRLKGNQNWIKKYSISEDNYQTEYAGDSNVATFIKIYNRIKWLSTNNTPVTTHKAIIRNLTQGVYEYRVGRENHLSDIYEFTVKSSSDAFSFAHISDQQAFNFYEYQAWTKSSWAINENHPNIDFTINTGDITQNGNRESEWIDYYNGRKHLRNKEEMYTIGNNDLCGIIPYQLGDGTAGVYKINHKNIQYYYTFELDENNPAIFRYVDPNLDLTKLGEILNNDSTSFTYYLPSVYSFNFGDYHFISLNSEIADNTYKIYYDNSNNAFKDHAYYNMYKWLETDLQNNSGKKCVAFMHEIPLCIIKKGTEAGRAEIRTNKNGSKLNNDFSIGVNYSENSDTNTYTGGCCFSELFQNYNVGLILGGHKHTYSLSYPAKENVIYSNGERTVDYNNPIINTTSNLVKDGPVYAMTQATGYKLISNKELPGNGISWLRKYFPVDVNGEVNVGQYNPMYSVVESNGNVLNFKSYAINNIYNGKSAFNINNQMSQFETVNSEEILGTSITIDYGNS